MRVKNSIKNSVLGIVYLFILTIFAFITTGLFVKNLGIEYAGLNGLFINILAVLSFTELGIAGAATYLLYKPIYDKDFDRVKTIMSLYKKYYRIVGTIIIILSLLISFIIQIFIKETTIPLFEIQYLFILFAFGSAVTYFFSYNRNLFYSTQKNYVVLTVDFIVQFIKYIFQIIAIIVYKNYGLYLIINIIFNLITNIIIHILSKKEFAILRTSNSNEQLKKEVKKSFFNRIKELSFFQITSIGINSTDNLLISSFINISTVGLYNNYNLIIKQVFSFIVSIFSGVGASIGDLIAENNKVKIKYTFKNIELIFFLINSFCVCSFASLIQMFISFWLGTQYTLNNSIVLILIVNFFLLVQRQVLNSFYSAAGYFKNFIVPAIIEMILNLVVSIILVKYMGLIGIFIGTLFSSVIAWVLQIKIFVKLFKLNLKEYIYNQFRFLIILILQLFTTYTINNFIFPSPNIISLISRLIVIIILLLISNCIVFRKNENMEYIKNILKEILTSIRKRMKYESTN